MKNGKGKLAESALRGERLQIMLDSDELRAVDTFRFEHRMPSRAAAVRELFRLGLVGGGDSWREDRNRGHEVERLRCAPGARNARIAAFTYTDTS